MLPLRRAAERAWRANARGDAAMRPSRRRARDIARERLRDGLRLRAAEFRPRFNSRSAWRLVRPDVLPRAGTGNGTPARRALDNPIAIACCGDRAPCFPSRT